MYDLLYRADNHSRWRERAASIDRGQSEGEVALCQQLHVGRRQAQISLDAHHFKGK